MRTRWVLFVCIILYFFIYYSLYVNFFDAHIFHILFANNSAEAEQLYDVYNKISWIFILFGTVFVIIRLFVVAMLMYAGYYVVKDSISIQNINISQFFKCLVYPEFVYIIQNTVLLFTYKNSPPTTISEFSKIPLSLYCLIGNEDMDKWLFYSLNSLNLFEILYCVILYLSFVFIMKLSKVESFKLLFYTYLPVLLLGYMLRIGVMYITM